MFMHHADNIFPVSHQFGTPASSKKRKASEDPDDRMTSPSTSPNLPTQALPTPRPIKRVRSSLVGRPLDLPRLLETLDAEKLRAVLRNICQTHPDIGAQVVKAAPRPSVADAINVLKRYEESLRHSFPYGASTNDYSYNRVRPQLQALLEALADFTPHFLPPNETQVTQSLNYLDSATEIIYNLPEWSSFQNNIHKANAYEEISKAWTIVIREASKRAGGMQLQNEGWDKKLTKHNQQAQGKLQGAVNELSTSLSWMGSDQSLSSMATSAREDIRNELLSGTFGSNLSSVRVGPW
jgi:protein Cut8